MASETKDVTEFMSRHFHEGPIAKKDKEDGIQFHSLWRDNTTVESAVVEGNNVKIVWRFPVLREYANPGYYLHGAAQALFGQSELTNPCMSYDQCIACLVIPLQKPGFWEDLGFTRNLNINYLRTAKIGEYVLMETELLQIGRSMGYMQGRMKRERDGAIVSTCEQNKFNSSSGSGMVAGKL